MQHKLKTVYRSRRNMVRSLLALFGFAVIGMTILYTALADVYVPNFEVESGSLSYGASTVQDSLASRGVAVKFGQASSQKFTILPVGSKLPGDAECAARVRRYGWEYDAQNTIRNNTVGSQLQNSYIHQIDVNIANRVNGNFTGTTDEILQWGACKWGFDEDDVRAQAVAESTWRQYFTGDCNRQTNTQFGFNGCESVGILQVRGAGIPPVHPGTWPDAYNSTAFNVDYTLAVRRLCFEGKETWLGNGYKAGDLWGCIGRWYSGDWYISSQAYITSVQNHLNNKPWVSWGYPGI